MSTTDQRYTDETLPSYSLEALEAHLQERRDQLNGAQAALAGYEGEIATMDDHSLEETSAGHDALANAASTAREIGMTKRAIAKLEAELARRAKAQIAGAEADIRNPLLDLIDEEIAKRGMPVTLAEAGDEGLAAQLWDRVMTGLEMHNDDTPTNREVACRVAGIYEEIWMPAPVTLRLGEDDAKAIREYLRDATAEAEREGRNGDWTVRLASSIDAQVAS